MIRIPSNHVTLHKFPKKEILISVKMGILVVQGSKKGNSGADQLMPAGIISYTNFSQILMVLTDNPDNP